MRRDLLYGICFLLISSIICFYGLKGGWWLLLLWPALSFLIVSISYLCGTEWFYGKNRLGERHWIATLVLCPFLLYMNLVWRIQIAVSNEPSLHYVTEKLIVARRLLAHEYPQHKCLVCDLTCEFLDPLSVRTNNVYLTYPILDASIPNLEVLVEIIKALLTHDQLPILIHCANGHGRTGLVAVAFLLATNKSSSVADALLLLQSVRPGIKLRPKQRALADLFLSNWKAINDKNMLPLV